jgi:20S proteasome subunit beta 6
MDLILDAFHSCAERDIYTGDQVEMLIIEPTGIQKLYFPLRKD